MARKVRVEYPGAIYHVMNRGDRREEIFFTDKDRELFLETLAEARERTGWHVFAYCLMPKHFHLVIETPRANLVAGMKWFLGTYTARFNRRHKLFGHLFSGRYKALIVDGSGNGYLKTVCDYVHLNPVRAKLVSSQGALASFPSSSYPQYLLASVKRPTWLRVERLLGAHGIPKDSAAGREEFEKRMEARRCAEEDPREWKAIRRGWMTGSDEFRRELLAKMSERVGLSYYGPELQESDEEKARRIIAEEIRRLKFPKIGLGQLDKSDSRKIQIAWRLRRETTVSLRWIAENLQRGSVGYLAKLIKRGTDPFLTTPSRLGDQQRQF
jgi:putative transposase